MELSPVSLLMILDVVHLNVDSLEVLQTSDDPLIIDASVQRVSMRLVVWVSAVRTPVVVEGCVLVQTINGCILSTIRDKHNQMELHAQCVALWNKESVWQAEAALELL